MLDTESLLFVAGRRWLLQNGTAVEPPPADAGLIDPHEGVWNPAMDVILCLLPIALLVMTTVWKRVHLDTNTSLPLAALLMWVIRLAYLKLDTNFTTAAVVYGLFDALKPLSVVTGAIILFEAMTATKCLPWMMAKVRSLSSGHPVAEVFLISWAFAYMIEGASGFGTPVALAAPMLVSLGHPPVESVTCCLIMNTLATVFGAVGFPLWFGLDGLAGVDDDDLKKVGLRAQIMLLACAHFVPIVAASFLVRLQDLRKSWLFILLAIWSAKLPALILSIVSTDFSSLIGGMIAVALVGVLAKFRVGLNKDPGQKFGPPESESFGSISSPETAEIPTEHARREMGQNEDDSRGQARQAHAVAESKEKGKVKERKTEEELDVDSLDPNWSPVTAAIFRTMPLWLTVLVLLLTRLEPVGLRDPLNEPDHNFDIHFGSLLQFELSRTLVFRISNILGEDGLAWKYEFLYIPFFLPFVVVSAVTVAVFRRSLPEGMSVVYPFAEAFRRVSRIAMALFGSLVLVSLIRNAESEGAAPAYIIGYNLSDALGKGFVVIAAALGALGSFFSGSTTVSNLTFGIVHLVAAESINVSTTALLALQSLGATAGNMVCINNIISARTVVGGEALAVSEGAYILRTAPALALMLVIATLVALPFLFL